MKTKDFACHLIALVLALLATTELAMGAVKGKLNPVRAGINTRTTYSLIPSTSSKNRPAAFCLAGADCRISADAQGKTIVEVKNGNGNFEPVEFVDDEKKPISVDWSNILIFVGDGFFIDEYEGARDNNEEPTEDASVDNHGVCYIGGSQQQYGTCTITMTGGSIYGIRAGGYAETDKSGYGCVYGNVNVNISGGEIYELCDHGSTYGDIGNAGVLYGHYNLTMTGGTYTNAKAPSIDNVTYEQNEVTTSSAIICGITYVFDTAVLQNTNIQKPNYVSNEGSFLQDYKNKVCTTAGILTINAGTSLRTSHLINHATLHNQGTITIDGCLGCWENNQNATITNVDQGTITFAQQHSMKEIKGCTGSTTEYVNYCIYCGRTEAGGQAHNFTNKITMEDRKKEDRTCSHGSIYYLSCENENCGIAANSDRFTFEADDKLPHDFEIKNITPDDGYPEAGVVEIECEVCRENLSFAFNAYTRVGRTSTNPNIWAIAEPAEGGSRVEPTCQPGSETYKLTISNGTPLAEGETDDGTKMKTVIGRYTAVLPAVPDKHAWNEQGVCEHCGSAETIVGSLIDYRQIYDGNQKPLLIEEVITPIKEEATFRAKFLEEIKKALGRRTFTIYKDMDFNDKLVANDTGESQLTFDLKGHTLKVPGILTKKKLNELTVKSGRLVTQHIQQEDTKCNIKVARENGASLLFDLEDDGTAYIQDSEVEAVGGNGIDAQFTRSYITGTEGKAIWQSLYLPFPVTLTSEMLADCDYAAVETTMSGTSENKGIYITKQPTSTVLEANKPYLIRPKTGGNRVISAQDIKISKAESKGFNCDAGTGTTLEFKGTYEPITGLGNKGYLFMSTTGNLSKTSKNDTTLKPYRWYAQVNSGSLAKVSIFTIGEDDEEDGIQWIEEVEAGTNNNAPTYDLSGRRVGENRRPGLYIRGGKKVVRQ